MNCISCNNKVSYFLIPTTAIKRSKQSIYRYIVFQCLLNVSNKSAMQLYALMVCLADNLFWNKSERPVGDHFF